MEQSRLSLDLRKDLMKLSMYDASVPVFSRMLGNLAGIVDKAAGHAHASAMPESHLLEARLHVTMFPLATQVQITVDGARGTVLRLAGGQPPVPEASDFAVFNRGDPRGFGLPAGSFAELSARVRQAVADVESFSPERIDGSEDRPITLTMHGRTRRFTGQPFLLNYSLPNFYFHVTTAYAILRHLGVPLGKNDYHGTGLFIEE